MNENAVLGWRFWAAFLGLGYLSGTMIIPNMKIRVQDVLATNFSKKFKFNEAIQAYDFIIETLEEAVTLMSEEKNNGRMNKYAARALLARVYQIALGTFCCIKNFA